MNLLASQRRVMHLLLLLATGWLISVAGALSAAEPLTWKFEVGGKYHYQMVQEMKMSMDLGPAGETVTSFTQTMDMIWEVEAIDENGTATVTQKISRMRMDITAPGQDTVHYDTESDETPQGYAAMLAPMLKALTSEKFTTTMLPSGEVTEVEVPKSLIEAMSRGPASAMMGGLASEEGFKNMFTQGSLTLPKPEDLVEGHKWSTSMEMANPAVGKIVIDSTYRYAGPREIEGQQFEVFIPTINTSFGVAEEPGAATVKVNKQETTGEILFNRSAGRLESSAINQQMDSTITVAGNTMNQKIDQKVSLKFVAPSDVAK
ncbi:MAG: hypothetical protein GXP26_15505 [Planctomycetes bacterium]|nr:hypothetical protein [Planctomycetota bacterium]